MRKPRLFNLTYAELGIAACSLLVAIAAFAYDIAAGDAEPVSQPQQATGGVNMGEGNHVGQIVINNYAQGGEPKSLGNIERQANSYADGGLTITPLECLRRGNGFRCNLKITASQNERLILETATLDSVNGRPYLSKAVGFEGGYWNSRQVADRLRAGVPTLVFAEFEGVPAGAQQGELFLPIQFNGVEDTARFSIVKQ